MSRGHCGVGIWRPCFDVNVGSLVRAARCFDADYAFTVGREYRDAASAVGHDEHLPIFEFDGWNSMLANKPRDTELVCVELTPDAEALPAFTHPERAMYVLGREGPGLPREFTERHRTVQIPTSYCLNVAMAGNIVLYDRFVSKTRQNPDCDSWIGHEINMDLIGSRLNEVLE